MGDRPEEKEDSGKLAEKTSPLPKHVEESNSIGAPAGDATSGVPESPEEWAERQPVEESPTFPLDAGDPSPLQPAAGSPDADPHEEEAEENRRTRSRTR